MKTIIALCLSLFVSVATAMAADVFPTISTQLQAQLKSLPGGFVSENQKAYHGGHVAITGPQGSDVYQLILRDVNYFPGCKEPVLISLNSQERFSPNENISSQETGNGTGTFSGFTRMLGQEVHFYCSNTTGPWSCVVTWGEGSGVNKAGKDTTYTGRKSGDPEVVVTPVIPPTDSPATTNEAVNSPAKPEVKLSFVGGQPILVCAPLDFAAYDYILQYSPDLSNWENIAGPSERLEGSTGTATILRIVPATPENGFGNRAFFKMVSIKK